MFIFKNESGIELTVDEFIELVDNDFLPEIIVIVAHLDSPAFVNELVGTIMEDDNDTVERIFKRFIQDE